MKKKGPDPDQKFLKVLKKANVMPPEFEIHQLLLEFIFQSHLSLYNRLVLGVFRPEYPIQEVPFEYGIRVTNIGKTRFEGGWVETLMISQESPKLTYLNPEARIIVPPLAPSESQELWCGRLKSHFQGAISVSCRIRPDNKQHAIETYQKISGAEAFEASDDQPSNWYITTFIEPRSELLSRNTNMLLLLLALLTFFEVKISGVWDGLQLLCEYIFRGITNR